MMFKFVAADGIGSPQKRQQTARACESCRRRKKRCHHADPQRSTSKVTAERAAGQTAELSPSSPSSLVSQVNNPRDQNIGENQPQYHTTPQENPVIPERSEEPSSQNVAVDSGMSRYIGDLSPEAIFAAATSPDATRGQSLDESVGVWLTTRPIGKALQSDSSTLRGPSNIFHGSSLMIQRVMVPMLEQECMSTIPSSVRLEALSKIYFEKVHPIFPVIDQDAYNSLDPAGPESVLLQQGICLAASKNFVASHLLVLNESEPALTCRQFGERISGAMRLSIEMGLVTNKLVTIQALALMSQFTDNPTGENMSLQHCGKAVLLAQSIGLHIRGQQDEARDYRRTTLFCCVWAIDKMDAAFNGHAVLIHDRDVSRDLEHCFEQQDPCFRLFLVVVKLLDTVIDLYRPTTSSDEATALSQSFPAFEDIVMKCNGSQIGTSALATIETLYHAIAILSSRSKSWVDPKRSSISYLRQSLSTTILSSTVTRELHAQFILFPFIPYALSLSLSVAYREMRHSKLPSYRARSRAQFQMLCDALAELESIFWSASTTSEMGKKLLKEMDRVFTVVSSSENVRATNGTTINTPAIRQSNNHMQDIQHEPPDANSLAIDGPQMSGMLDFDPSIFDSLADVDLFEMFDPAFDLDGFDACLEGNLNPGLVNFQ